MHLEHHTASQHYLGARSLACYGEKELGYSQLLCWGMEELGRCFAVLMVEGALHLLGGWGKAKREFGCSLPCTRWSFSSGLLLLVCREQEESVPTVCLLSFHLELLDCCFLPLLDYQRLGQNGGNAKYLQPWVKSPSSPFLCHWATNITVTHCSMEHSVLWSILLWQENGPASVSSLFPIWLLTQNVFPSWSQAVGLDLLTQPGQLVALWSWHLQDQCNWVLLPVKAWLKAREISSIPYSRKCWVRSCALLFPQVFLQLDIIPVRVYS